MTWENERIHKCYYQTIINESKKQGSAVKVLGEMYMEEMEKQTPNLSSIRFAQGEVYFLHQDYEAAIFKWQQPLEEELIPWAEKNIADAHMELGLLDDAEGLYQQVVTSSLVLQTEVLLQLFSLYVQQSNHEKAVSVIKEAVTLNPDYPNLTEIAKAYFEDRNDWDHAMELAFGEAIRTHSIYWIDVLSGYVQKGWNANRQPDYFSPLLIHLLQMDSARFENFTEVLWNSYKSSAYYLDWLHVINQLLTDLQHDLPFVWEKLPDLYQEAYFELISGQFLINDIAGLLQLHLANWLEITAESDAFMSATAILAWEETIPSMLDVEVIGRAAYLYENATSHRQDRINGVQIFDSIQAWATKEGLYESLQEAIRPMENMEAASPEKMYEVIKTSIAFLLEQRVALEKGMEEDIHWNEDMLAMLEHTHEQIGAMEQKTVAYMTDSFHEMKDSLTKQVYTELPKQLQQSASIIQEDSDFSTIQQDLNEEMNRRIVRFMNQFVNNDVKHKVHEWLDGCKREFREHQVACDELSHALNQQFGEEKIALQCDGKVLEDWQRDLERISRGSLRLQKVNLFNRNTASQLLLKGAGKLIGSFSKNNDMLYQKYRSYVENEDYNQVVKDLLDPFLQQLEFFEGSIEWDVSRFFSQPLEIIKVEMEHGEAEMESHTSALQKMHENPETYRDPLTLFELRLYQYALIHGIRVDR
ncbi:tetratricopeptide repeat protein [Gracilibacillus marinus]|uniref:Tetratricopeptide repeat protein n=1 Tax=Gracilibacillus marinus TaxID=630535 RepID=A0ABV8VTU5_9BACI